LTGEGEGEELEEGAWFMTDGAQEQGVLYLQHSWSFTSSYFGTVTTSPLFLFLV